MKLSGDYKGYWECHISPDWLLLYEKDTEIRIISLCRTGTHADIFLVMGTGTWGVVMGSIVAGTGTWV